MLPSPKHELFARALSQGSPVTKAAEAAGVTRRVGQDWKNGTTPAQKAIQARIAYLRQTAVKMIPSAVDLFHKMLRNAEAAEEAGQHKAAQEAYWKLYEERKAADFDAIEAQGEPVLSLVSGDEDDPIALLREGDEDAV